MSDPYTTNVDVTYTSSGTSSPGQWTFSDNRVTIPSSTAQYTINYNLSGGWQYAAISLHKLGPDGSPSEEPFITVKEGQTPIERYSLSRGSFQIWVRKFDHDLCTLVISNDNRSDEDLYLGLALTVESGSYTRTSQDPQIYLPKKQN